MAKRKQEYGNDSISMLEGADRVRKRPGVIFGSDGLEGCEHAVFEILSNAIDEAREGHGRHDHRHPLCRIAPSRWRTSGRGCPVDWNEKEQQYNWELVFCELYAGGKYDNDAGDNYEYSLGLNGLGACATQYASRVHGRHRLPGRHASTTLHFEKGETVGELQKAPCRAGKKTGTRIRWLPDLDVFTDIDIPAEYFTDVLKRQAVVNAGVTFRFRNQGETGFDETVFPLRKRHRGLCDGAGGEDTLTTPVQFWQAERTGPGPGGQAGVQGEALRAPAASPTGVHVMEHYHNSSWLEHGGAPEKAVQVRLCLRHRRVPASRTASTTRTRARSPGLTCRTAWCLVSNNFSTQTSYENQTKKAITNKFIQEAMTEFLRAATWRSYFIENPYDAEKIAEQVLINKRSREKAEKTRLNIKKEALRHRWTSPTGCRSLWTAAPRTWPGGRCTSWRATPPWAA